jgi:hypothetical protein
MPPTQRLNIQKRKQLIRLREFETGDIARNDLAEDTVWVGVGCHVGVCVGTRGKEGEGAAGRWEDTSWTCGRSGGRDVVREERGEELDGVRRSFGCR